MGLYSSRFWRPANRHGDKVYVMFIDKSKILLIYAHLNESLRKKKKEKKVNGNTCPIYPLYFETFCKAIQKKRYQLTQPQSMKLT